MLTDDNVIDLVSTQRVTPVSIFYFALGKTAAAELPGRLGNILLSAAEVPASLGQLERALQGDKDTRVTRGAELYQLDHFSCEGEVAQILESWPAAFRAAIERGAGLLSFAVQAP